MGGWVGRWWGRLAGWLGLCCSWLQLLPTAGSALQASAVLAALLADNSSRSCCRAVPAAGAAAAVPAAGVQEHRAAVLGRGESPAAAAAAAVARQYKLWQRRGCNGGCGAVRQQRLALALGHQLPAARVLCLQIAALQVGPEYNPHFANLYTFFIAQLAALMPPGTNIPEAYARGSDEDQAFVQNLALFLTAFFRAHLGWVWVQLGQWGSGLWLWACACQAAAEASCGRLEAPCLRTSPQASACQP